MNLFEDGQTTDKQQNECRHEGTLLNHVKAKAVIKLMKRSDLKDYFALTESFCAGQIDALQFETRYLALFKAEQCEFSEPVYQVLNKLFADVDIFVADPTLRAELRVEPILEDTLDEVQLLECARDAHAKLTKLLSDA